MKPRRGVNQDTGYMISLLRGVVLLGIIAIPCSLMLPPLTIAKLPNTEPLTTWEQAVATRCETFFTGNPHVLFVFGEGSANWILKPENLHRVTAAHMGAVVLFKGFYTTGDATVGVQPAEGETHLEWRKPEYMAKFIQLYHDLDMEVLAYFSPHVWPPTGLQLIDEVERLGIDGAYLDGWQIGENIHETVDTLGRMKVRGMPIYTHGSIQPHLGSTQEGRVTYRMPGWSLATWTLWGETNAAPTKYSELSAWLNSQVSSIELHAATLPMYKPHKGDLLDRFPQMRGPMLVELLIAERASPATLPVMEQYYLPSYNRERAAYHADSDGYVRKKAEELR